tara:strand:+ start:1848 stop:3434 length:1587 start_codon:yes stop_codon:yes gene_type:complete
MNLKLLLIRYSSFLYIFFLLLISFSVNQYYAYIGILPVDTFSTFNAGYDVLNGSIPFKDYWIIKGVILDFIQALYFKIFGVSWFSYALHSSSFNSFFALSTFFTLRKFNLKIGYSFIYSALASILMYPTYGIPFTDHSTAIFCILAIYSLCLAIKTNKNIYWSFIPILIFLAFFTKQSPSGYIGILIIIISLLYFILNFNRKIFYFGFVGCCIPIVCSMIYIHLQQIPYESILIQYFLYPMSLGETRIEWLFPFEFQRFVFRHKLIYFALSIPIFLFFKNIFKNFISILDKDNLIFLSLIFTLFIFITHQLMTINGLYIFFLIPVFAGFSHIYSSTFKNKNRFINFFLILSVISTVYYHQKYISKRDTLILREHNLNKSINASIIDKKLKNLRWITHLYPDNPNEEIEKLLNSIQIIKNDNRKKMIVTDYQFISVILSLNDNSAARIWWKHHLYPVPGYKYFEYWRSFLLKKIINENIEVIYTVQPLAGEDNIFEGLIDDNCYSNIKINENLVEQKLNNCEELVSINN